MATPKPRKTPEPESVAQVPQLTPSMVGMGMPGHDFTLQAVMELQKAVGELNANVQAMKTSIDGVKGKVDDLVGWKNKILGGAAVLLAVVSVLAFVLGKASDYVTFKSPPASGQVATPSSAVVPSSPASGPNPAR